MKGLFVTGTDTGVGKTLISAALVDYLRRDGIDVGVMKPIETGVTCDGALAPDSDAGLLKRHSRSPADDRDINPIRLAEPLAPSVAAARIDRRLELDTIMRSYERICALHSLVIVEGCGGLLVPIGPRLLISDLAKNMGLPLLVVSRAGLGTINHTGLTVEAARRRGLTVAGVLINGHNRHAEDLAELTSPAEIARQFGVSILGRVPRLQGIANLDDDVGARIEWLSRHLSEPDIAADLLRWLTPVD